MSESMRKKDRVRIVKELSLEIANFPKLVEVLSEKMPGENHGWAFQLALKIFENNEVRAYLEALKTN